MSVFHLYGAWPSSTAPIQLTTYESTLVEFDQGSLHFVFTGGGFAHNQFNEPIGNPTYASCTDTSTGQLVFEVTDMLGDIFQIVRVMQEADLAELRLELGHGLNVVHTTSGPDYIPVTGYGGHEVHAGEGNDTLVGSNQTLPNDVLIGGPGDDVYLSAALSTVIEARDGGIDTVVVDDMLGLTRLPDNVEIMRIVRGGAQQMVGNDGDNIFYLSPLHSGNVVDGAGGNDTFIGAPWANGIEGGAGLDTMLYDVPLTTDWGIWRSDGQPWRANPTGQNWADKPDPVPSDYFYDVERLHFTNVGVALDMDGNAGNVAKGLGVIFGAPAVTVPQYVSAGLVLLDGGMAYDALLEAALALRLGANASHADMVDLMYFNLAGVHPSPAQAQPFIQMLDTHAYTPGALAHLAGDSEFNTSLIGLQDLALHGLQFSL